jgi:two-component system alkaline phosphatase synthesis response regulator PhoP
MKPVPQILVVEDERHLAIGIKFNLEQEGFSVSVAGDGQSALQHIADASPPVDLVVLDIMLPGMSGYAVCEAIREDGNTLPIVMLTARTLVEDRIRGFDSGADVYLQKPFDLDELISVVRSLLSRRGHRSSTEGSPELFRFGNNTVNFDTWEAQHGEQDIRLTNLEMKLLKYFVDHEGSVISRQELLERVWGMTHAPATRTVDTFIFNLRKTFEEDPSQPVHFLSVRGQGYRFVARPE